jgi:hypothetical protein
MLKYLWTYLAGPMKRRMLVHINYKSGIQEEFWVHFFHKTLNRGGGLHGLNWVPADGYQKPFVICVDEIESVWLQGAKGIFTMPKSMDPDV